MKYNLTINIKLNSSEAMKSINKTKEILKDSTINQAIALLQSHGYTLTPPYIPPTDEEIIARIVSENEKVGYVSDWNDGKINKYFIRFDNEYKEYAYTFTDYRRNIGVIYTTQSIAQQITTELNEKRFVRV